MKHYEVIAYESPDLQRLLRAVANVVSDRVEDGWTPQGGVQIVNMDGYFIVAQAMLNR